MSSKCYRIHLSESERVDLMDLVDNRSPKSTPSRRARILLAVDESDLGGKVSDGIASETFRISKKSIERLRKSLYENGLEIALYGKPRKPSVPTKLDGGVEAHLIALRCQEVPEGQNRWTLRLLADQMVELGYVECISHEGVRRLLKKTNSSPGKSNPG